MKRLLAVALLSIFVGQATSVDIPQHFGDSIRFSRMGQPTGLLSEHRFLEAMFLAANTIGAKKLPRTLVVHIDDFFGKLLHTDSRLKMEMIITQPKPEEIENDPDNLYILFVEGSFDDSRMTIAASQIVGTSVGKTKEEVIVYQPQILKELSATVEVQALQRK